MKKVISIFIMLISLSLLTGCKIKNSDLGINFKVEGNEASIDYETENPLVAMKIKGYGAIIIELYPDVAPNTVNNFISLTKNGFYDNNTFHRLAKGFVLQGGDPTGTGTGGPGYHIQGEFSANNFKNDLKHTRGIVSMARSSLPNSAGSQFFIMLGTAEHLDGNYAAFGKVVKGMENVEKIEKNAETVSAKSDQLKENLIIEKAIVDTKGTVYNEVEKL
ncbi:MAG: peptidylprolyl isomerase [Firmicutes bacterium]|nr:peptidylprolyl isomerase [Bacillota bacterium]